MSAKRAAQALLDLDTNLAEFASTFGRGDVWMRSGEVVDFVRDNVMNTWTLTLAARSTGATEQQVIAALLHLDPIRVGTTCVCQGIAAQLFAGDKGD